MPTVEQMTAVVHAYFAAFARADADAIAALCAAGCTLEDPVGSTKVQGLQAVRAFYAQAFLSAATLEREGEVRVAANHAAVAFSVLLVLIDFAYTRIDVINTFKFDEDGKIVELRAFWGPGNVHAS